MTDAKPIESFQQKTKLNSANCNNHTNHSNNLNISTNVVTFATTKRRFSHNNYHTSTTNNNGYQHNNKRAWVSIQPLNPTSHRSPPTLPTNPPFKPCLEAPTGRLTRCPMSFDPRKEQRGAAWLEVLVAKDETRRNGHSDFYSNST